MAEGSGFSKKQMRAYAERVNGELKKIDEQLKILHDSLNRCMTGSPAGSGTAALWNGADALIFYNAAKKNITKNIEDYERAYEIAQDLAVSSEIKN